MSRVILSLKARQDVQRLYAFLANYDENAAQASASVLIASLKALQTQPTQGAPVADRPHVRKVVVSFGASGYLVFHKRYEHTDINLILRIIHQKEWYEAITVGLDPTR